LTTVDQAKGERLHSRPQFLPDGKQLLFTVPAASGPPFAVLHFATGGFRTLVKGGDNGRYSPSGHLTYVRDATLFALPFDLRTLAATGSETPVVEGISSIGPTGTGDYTFSETGVLVYSERQGS